MRCTCPLSGAKRTCPSSEETVSQQLGARGNDCDQHQLLERLRCNFIAHMLSDVHAKHDWQHRSRRDRNVEPTELAASRQKNSQQTGRNDEIQRRFLCERLSAQSLCKQKYENKRSRHRCDASQNPAEKSEGDAAW